MIDTFTTGWGWNVPAPAIPRAGPTLRSILADVCADHQLPSAEVTGIRRHLPLVRARQDFMWRARQIKTPDGAHRYSLPQIGRFLGGMDHTTVLHGAKAHAKRMEIAA